ncbi:hypothetical protein D1872_236580 [compost metagenome]
MHLGIGIDAGGNERGILQRTAPVNLRIEERDERSLNFLEELFLQPRFQQRQQIFVAHVQEDRFPFQPSRRKRANPADFMRFPVQADRGFVHAQLVVKQVAAANQFVSALRFRRVLQRLHPAGRTLQEMRQRADGKFLHHRFRQPVAANHGVPLAVQHRFVRYGFKGEVGRREPVPQRHGFRDPGVDFVQHLTESRKQIRKPKRALLPGDAVTDALPVTLAGRGHLVPIGEGIQFAA